ncbi:MAG: aminotransferase class I/II-fold pyridoxal phosphate-dependent enzyme [Vicinamibacterales bacterium]|nr:aminotransferase class I/II-fold pyridoxal phosphate-dependent enzyme [Vicinamibacterales bacterium]
MQSQAGTGVFDALPMTWAAVQEAGIMNSIDRRRFLQTGALGIGAGLLQPGVAQAQGGASGVGGQFEPASTRVRMTGDGLGLTAGDQGRLLTRLAEEGRIDRDSYSNGGTVQALEERCAAMLGKERAVFMPTGTLANQLAVRALAGAAGGRAILQAESHLFNDSGDCVQTLSAINVMPLAPGTATFTLDQVEEVLDRTASGRVTRPVSVISIETPVRRRSGETFDQAELERVTDFARREGIGLHLDGARLFLQSAYTGVAVGEYARPFDTVYVSLYKYFNAVSGAILAGPRALLDDMYHTRRMFGAGLPGAWPFAAVALHYLPGFVDRFRKAVAVSEAFIEQIAQHDAFTVARIGGGTNLFILRVGGSDAAGFRRRLGERGVDLGAPRPGGTLLVGVNETWNRISADDLAARFVASL